MVSTFELFLMFCVLSKHTSRTQLVTRSTLPLFPSAHSDDECKIKTKPQLMGGEAISQNHFVAQWHLGKYIKALNHAQLKNVSSCNGDSDFCTHLKLYMGLNTFFENSSCLVNVQFKGKKRSPGERWPWEGLSFGLLCIHSLKLNCNIMVLYHFLDSIISLLF